MRNPMVTLQKSLAREVQEVARALPQTVRDIATAIVLRRDATPLTNVLAEQLTRVSMAGDLASRISFGLGTPRKTPEIFSTEAGDPTVENQDIVQVGWMNIQIGENGEIPPVPFKAAIDYLRQLDPQAALNLLRMGEQVATTYTRREDPRTKQVTSGYGYLLATARAREIAKATTDLLAESMTQAKTPARVAEEIADQWEWPLAYATRVVRTTYTMATSAGTIQEAKNVENDGFKVELVFQTAGDVDVRSGRKQDRGENHAAMDGYRAPVHSSVWEEWTPPLGHACRCIVTPEIVDTYATIMPVPAAARKAPGFGKRPDRAAYGG